MPYKERDAVVRQKEEEDIPLSLSPLQGTNFSLFFALCFAEAGVEMINLIYGRLMAFVDKHLPIAPDAVPDFNAAALFVVGAGQSASATTCSAERTVSTALRHFGLGDRYSANGECLVFLPPPSL